MDFQVFGFERGSKAPTLISDVFNDWPRQLFHIQNLLILQILGGASDQVYVFSFEKNKPKLVLKMATKDQIQVRLVKGGKQGEVVPPVTYPDQSGKFPSVTNGIYRYAVE